MLDMSFIMILFKHRYENLGIDNAACGKLKILFVVVKIVLDKC